MQQACPDDRSPPTSRKVQNRSGRWRCPEAAAKKTSESAIFHPPGLPDPLNQDSKSIFFLICFSKKNEKYFLIPGVFLHLACCVPIRVCCKFLLRFCCFTFKMICFFGGILRSVFLGTSACSEKSWHAEGDVSLQYNEESITLT